MKKVRLVSLVLCVAMVLSASTLAMEDIDMGGEQENYFTLTDFSPVGEPFEVTPEMVLERQNARSKPRPEWPEEIVLDENGEQTFTINILESYSLENYPSDLDSGMTETDSGQVNRAALADLRVDEIKPRPNYTPPPVGAPAPFEVKIANYGGTAAQNPTISIYVDNVLQATTTLSQTFGPGEGYLMEIIGPIARTVGNHVVKMHVNSNAAIAESNYNNNTRSGTFNFTTWPNLSAYEVVLEPDGSHYFHTVEDVTFVCSVVNLGPTTATNIPLIIYFDTGTSRQKAAQTTIASLAANQGVQYRLNGRFNNYIDELIVDLQVDPLGTTRDAFLDNNTLWEFYMVEPDREVLPGAWTNPENISVQMKKETYDLLYYGGIDYPVSYVNSTIRQWNGRSAASFGNVLYYADDRNVGANVIINTAYMTDTTHASTNVSIQQGEIKSAVISLGANRYTSTNASDLQGTGLSVADYKTYILQHEAGHALGLDDMVPAELGGCKDYAIMRYPKQQSFSKTIAWHDEYNLIETYGY